MINNKELKKFIFILILINILTVIYFSMNIKLRNDEIWKLRVENEDLKEQIFNLEGRN